MMRKVGKVGRLEVWGDPVDRVRAWGRADGSYLGGIVWDPRVGLRLLYRLRREREPERAVLWLPAPGTLPGPAPAGEGR